MLQIHIRDTGFFVDRIHLVNVPESIPKPGEVRVKVHACSINRTDIERIKGSYGGVLSSQTAFRPKESGVYIPGLEPAGVIDAVGPGIDCSLLGQRVLVHSHTSCGTCKFCRTGFDNACPHMRVLASQTPGIGGWSEKITVPFHQVVAIPNSLSFEEASTLEVTYGTVWWALKYLAELSNDDLLAVSGGTGSLAVAAVQMSKIIGTRVVNLARDPSKAKSQVLQEFGSDKLYPYDVLPETVESDFGRLPNVILELAGGDATAVDMKLVEHMGKIIVLGAHVGAISEIRLDELFHKNLTLQGSARAPLSVMNEVIDMAAQKLFAPFIGKTFSVHDVKQAVQYADEHSGRGKVILNFDSLCGS